MEPVVVPVMLDDPGGDRRQARFVGGHERSGRFGTDPRAPIDDAQPVGNGGPGEK